MEFPTAVGTDVALATLSVHVTSTPCRRWHCAGFVYALFPVWHAASVECKATKPSESAKPTMADSQVAASKAHAKNTSAEPSTRHNQGHKAAQAKKTSSKDGGPKAKVTLSSHPVICMTALFA